MSETKATVRKRRVFYIPGYDPFPPRRYRELYRKESKAQAAVSGYEIAQKPRKSDGGPFGWDVTATMGGGDVQARIEVLVWSDIVRSSMRSGVLATYLAMIRLCWTYLASGAFFRLARLRKGPVIAALYPIVMLIGQLVLALLIGRLAGAILSLTEVPGIGWAGLAVSYYSLWWFRKLDGNLFAYYLTHDYAFSARHNGANPPELEARMAEFRTRIAAAMASDIDEVLVVGHSSGAHLAVSVLADLIRAGEVPANGPALSFLSLGQVVPMMSFLPKADVLRRDLQFLSVSDRLSWVDVTAPGDGCAFALCDPVSVSGVATEGKRWPLVLSAAFTQTLAPETWKKLRWRFFRLHFQYLCAFDRPGDYEYFAITAGPHTLGERFAGREPSKSRIEAPQSHYTSTAA
ncbi:hypothetical protein ACMU_07555 [Actibacterium mucosum KCTC 23349]|uniref:Uncharacterized protein n=1 Tax=Actibacterium mucosum KCTC 23349 TaxID=1454373 RepID=A0A037ZPM5_9RHOB|nr:hypothetical protein [Actibacterium mucosum]KAJ56786.1 hypothetical protein ACMU_07555 [Actibacterium mucosum KCTC 23349]